MIFNSENTCFLEKFMLQSCKLNMNIYPLLYADFYLTTFLTTTLKNTSKKSSREERLFDHSFDHNRRKNVWNQWSSEFRKPCNIVNKRTKMSRKTQENWGDAFGSRMPQVRILSLGPWRVFLQHLKSCEDTRFFSYFRTIP